jgi:hypothetical protein
MYEHDSWMFALNKTSRKYQSCFSYSHSLTEDDKCNTSGELCRFSLIAYLYGMTRCDILYVEFQRVSMSHGTLNLLKFNLAHKT